jgi:glycogen synthase
MKILVLTNLYPPHVLGGYEILCEQVCGLLEQSGHSLYVLTSDHGLTAAPSGVEMHGNTSVERSLKLYIPFDKPAERCRNERATLGKQNYARTAAVISEFKPDLIFVWSMLRVTIAPARAAEASRLPVVYTFNDENICSYQAAKFEASPRKVAAWLLDAVMHDITLAGLKFPNSTCISQKLKDNLLAKGLPIQNSRVIYQGIPIERFPLKESPGEIAAGSVPRLLYAGQLHHYKGVHTILEAAKLLSEREIRFSVDIAGDGPKEYKADLQRLAADCGVPVNFLGKQGHDTMPALYRDHDIFLFPSIWPEPFGLIHLEAMASGLPVISTAGGGQGEFLKDGINSLVFKESDAGGLAGAILRLIENPELRRNIALQGRKTVEQEFTLQGYVSRLNGFLQETAGGKQ